MTVFQSMLNNTAYLHRRVRTDDGRGGYEISYTANGTADARIRDASSAERTVAQQEERQITHVLYLEIGTDILRGDAVTIDELTVEVDAFKKTDRENDYLALEHLEMDCLERQMELEPGAYFVTEDGDTFLITEVGDFLILE